jgi:hypothetical protein
MTDAERRRRYQAYALQQGINKPLRVEEPQTKPSVSVQPAQPTRFKVRVSPNVEVKSTARVTSPFMQPTAPTQDTRMWASKAYDQINPFDKGRSFKNLGYEKNLNIVERNLTGSGVFNVIKEAGQGIARLPIEIGQTVEQQYRVVQETEKLKKQGLTDEQAAKEVESRIKSKTWRPAGWQKRLFGDKAESYQAQAQEVSQLIEAETGKKPSPAAITAGLIITSGPMGGTSKYRKPFVKALTKSKDVDEIVELAAKEGIELTKDNATLIAMSEKPNDIVNLLDNAVDTGDVAEAVVDGVPKAANATSTISDDVVTQVTKSKSATEVKEAVQALFPTLAPKEVDDISVQLAKSKDIDEVRSVLEEARIRSDQVTQTVDAAVPEGQPVTQAAQQEQELAQAVQDGTAPQTVTQAPEQQITTEPATQSPKSIEGATDATDIPGVADGAPQPTNINDIDLQTTAQKIAKRTGRAYNAVLEELYDPYLVAQRLDDDLAKQVGISKSDANLALASRQITKKLSDETDATEFANETFTRPLSNGESMSNVFNRNPDVETKNGLYNPFIEYLHNRFFLEIYEKSDGKIWKSQNFTPEQVKDRIAQFEAQNPSAQTDAMLAREWKDVLVDEGVRFGQISEEIGNDLRKYENFVPLERAVDEDFVRPTVSGGVGSVGRNNVAQVLTEQAGNYDQSLESLMQRAAKVFGQTRKNATNIELFNRIQEGSLKAEDGWVVYVDPAKTKARRELVAKMEATRATLESARKGRNKLATKKSLTKKDVKQAETEAAETARQYYISQAVDDAGVSFARKLSRQELLEVFDVLVEASEINAKRTINKLSKKGGEYKRLSEQLQLARDEVKAIKAELSGDWKTAQSLYEKAPAGENKVAGFINGEKFVIGVSDDYARMRNKIEKSKNDTVAQISGAIATPQKVVATGLGNPVFLVKDVVRRQGVKLTNSQGLSPFGARPLASWFAGLTSPEQSVVFANLRDAGFIPEKATKVGYTVGDKAQDIASRADYGSRIAYLAKNPGKLWNSFNKFAAKLGNADRVQIGYGAYLRAKRLYPELTDAQAWEAGAKAANEALGNFRRTSLTARRLEAVAPYTTATQAGYRSLMRRFREAPVETSLKVGGILGTLIGVTAYNAEQYLDYYDQKIESGNTNDLDNNIIFILPGAHLNEETGEWEGIVKIPVAPDFRPLVRGSWRAAYDKAKTGQVNVKNLAKEFTNFMSADQGSNVYTQKGGFLPQSPVKKGIQIEQGIDPYTGKPLVTDEYMATKPKTEQFDKYSSDFAKSMSVRFNGALSPKEVDAWLNQMGYFADIIQGYSDKGVSGAVTKPFKNIFVGSKGFTEKQRQGKAYGEDVQAVSRTFDDAKQFRIWQSQFRTGRTDSKGVKVGSAQLDSAEKALALFNNQEVLEAEMDMNARQSERTGNSNPLLDSTLTPQQRDAVLMYRSMKAPNAAKQNYTKGGESAFVSLGLDEKWYEDFKAKENAYWDKVLGESDGGVKTFSGKEKPQATPELQKKLDYYYTLPKGTGDRSSFLKANQDVIDYWNAQNDFTNEERAALGFRPLAKEESTASGFRVGGSATKKANLDELIRQIDTGITPTKIRDLAPKKTKFKVKLPSSSNGRSYKRIRLQ